METTRASGTFINVYRYWTILINAPKSFDVRLHMGRYDKTCGLTVHRSRRGLN